MKVKAIYDEIGGNYQNILQRVFSDDNIIMLLSMLLEDDSYANFMKCMEQENYAQATDEIHGLKGICGNLSIDSLYDISVDILSALRAGDVEHAKRRQGELTACYEKVITKAKEII